MTSWGGTSRDNIVTDFNDQYDVDDSTSAPMYWFHRRAHIPEITEVALSLFVTPNSSNTSEMSFSLVNRTITSDRSRMKSSNLGRVLVKNSTIGPEVVSRTITKNGYLFIDSQIDEGNYAVGSKGKWKLSRISIVNHIPLGWLSRVD